MKPLTIALVLLALVIAWTVSYFQYFFRKSSIKEVYLLFVLRIISVFALLILLINPKFDRKIYELVKPSLLVATDNSFSISFTKQDSTVIDLLNKISNSEEINEIFDVKYFTFGSSVKRGEELSFDESKTNISDALDELNKLSNQQIAPIVLISDGNQTFGSAYKYFQSNQEIYSFIIGDTLQLADLKIDQINVNSYSFLNNNFPVEVFLHYKGDEKIQVEFVIESQNRIIFKQNIVFSSNKKSHHLELNLPASKIGKQLYKARINPFEKEKNVINNIKNFSVEVIDEQTKIALVYDVIHPDVGMLKRSIETNKQRKVELLKINEIENYKFDYNAFILYQPNNKFNDVFEYIKNHEVNYLLITGKSTDWNFLNEYQDIINKQITVQTENYYPNYNNNYHLFMVEDIGFSEFPALDGYLGELKFSVPYESILTQHVNGIDTGTPLLASTQTQAQRAIILLGENIWKWRAQSFIMEKSFQKFDEFLSSIIQYLTIVKQLNAIELEFKTYFYSDEDVKVRAKAYDTNFNFNANAEMFIKMEDSPVNIPFYTTGNYFEVNLGALKSGQYRFEVIDTKNNAKRDGEFTVIEYSMEQEVTHSNMADLKALAINSNGKLFHPSQFKYFVDHLKNNGKYTSVQKEKIIPVSLIDWKWLLGIIIVSLSLEWFIRKYRGLI